MARAAGRAAFFTMELVEGVDFLTYVRMGEDAEARVRRLREALRQLVHGVAYLHRGNKVHRDLKPSNVLVTSQGRVVVLDFGLMTDTGRDLGEHAHIVGTPAYMAPEQATGALATPAADWYAVGVMLFEGLTGALPFGGSSQEVIASKRASDPPLARLLAPDAPADLEALCARLLHRDPASRPDLAQSEIGARAGRHSGAASEHTSRDTYVGREQERRTLDRVFERALDGRCAWARVHGVSGMGKSALVDAWLDDVRARHPHVLVFRGRCYEREAVPYKALDGVIDALARHLSTRPRVERARLWPAHGSSLAALFPVLASQEEPGASERGRGDPRERFQRGALALRSLLARLRAERPVIVSIDDLQWGDLDSIELLSELVGFAGAPALCLVTCHRREEAESSPILAEALALSRRAVELDSLDVAVDGLDEQDGRRMVSARLGEVGAGVVENMLRDARGSPYLLDELCRGLGGRPREDARNEGAPSEDAGGGDGQLVTARASLDAILISRARGLPEAARRLLEVVALAGRPVHRHVVQDAIGRATMDPKHVLQLRADRLIRARTEAAPSQQKKPNLGDSDLAAVATGRAEASVEWLECYHDRVREAVLTTLDERARPALHGQLARALIAAGIPDAEAIGRHLLRAGERARAGEYFERAADLATGALAFERGARLYRQALECAHPQTLESAHRQTLKSAPGPPESREAVTQRHSATRLDLLRRLAETLANGGYSAESATVFAEIATCVPRTEVALVRRNVAEQLWRGGRLPEGRAVARDVLRTLGFGWPDGNAGVLLRLVVQRARLWFRMRAAPRVAPTASPADIGAILDAGYFFGNFLSGIEPLRGMLLHTEALLRAFAESDGQRVGRGFTIEAFIRAWRARDPRRVDELLARGEALTRDAPPGVRAQALCGRAAALCARTDFAGCRKAATEAEQIFLTQCQSGYQSEAALARWMRHTGLFYTGAWRELCRDFPHHRRDCEHRDDALLGWVGEAHFGWLAPLLADDTEGMFATALRVAAFERRVGLQLAHSSPRMVDALARRYSGDGEGSLRALRALWPELVRQGVRFIAAPEMRFRMDDASSALTALTTEPGTSRRRVLLAHVQANTRRIRALPLRVAGAMAGLLDAGLAAARGDLAGAVREAARWEEQCDVLELPHYAAGLRRQRGLCVGGSEGAALVREANAWFVGAGAVNPARVADFLAPGFARR